MKLVISLGGSLIVPNKIDTRFLSDFRSLILFHVKKGKKFFIIAGGGRTARTYQSAAASLGITAQTDLDWIGIHATRLNAVLLSFIFKDHVHPKILTNPTKKPKISQPIAIGCGWRPGCSTDKDAVLLAKTQGIKTILNLTNIDYVYTKDPKKHPDAKPIKEIQWKDYLSLTGEKWNPGANYPFDPIASKLAWKHKLKVIIMNGKDLKNLHNFLLNKPFKGTVIR